MPRRHPALPPPAQARDRLHGLAMLLALAVLALATLWMTPGDDVVVRNDPPARPPAAQALPSPIDADVA